VREVPLPAAVSVHDEEVGSGFSPRLLVINVKVNKEDGTDLYLQVAAQIRRAIADGEATPGERLPPARDLATVLGVNTNTVLRSLRLLQDEGLLELRRRRGITVAGTPERGAVMQKVRELVEFARGQGYSVHELVEMIETSPNRRRAQGTFPHTPAGTAL
jgi:GntR family transcriptional regulator